MADCTFDSPTQKLWHDGVAIHKSIKSIFLSPKLVLDFVFRDLGSSSLFLPPSPLINISCAIISPTQLTLEDLTWSMASDPSPKVSSKWFIFSITQLTLENLTWSMASNPSLWWANKAGYMTLGAPNHLHKRRRYGATDGWTDGRTDGRTDGWMDGLTDRPSYRGAL